MKVLNSSLSAEFQKEAICIFHMVDFGFSTNYRINNTECTIYDTTDNNPFYSRGFEFEDIISSTSMAVDELTISVDDTDQALSSLVLGEDVRNKTIKLYFGVVAQAEHTGMIWDTDNIDWSADTIWSGDYTYRTLTTQEFMRGILSSWELCDDNIAKITVKNELVLWSKKVLRTHTPTCPWVFWSGGVAVSGHPECRYSGAETWCDQTYDRCLQLSNTDNFGGFRFIPSLIDKEIWWGRSNKYSG